MLVLTCAQPHSRHAVGRGRWSVRRAPGAPGAFRRRGHVTLHVGVVGFSAAALACSEATAPPSCNPSLVGTWATTDTVDVSGLNTSALHDVFLRFARRTDVASPQCERFIGQLDGTGTDGRSYSGRVDDSVVASTAPPAPPGFRLYVYVQVLGSQRGEGAFASVFTGAFTDSVTFSGAFDLGGNRTSRTLRFRRVSAQ